MSICLAAAAVRYSSLSPGCCFSSIPVMFNTLAVIVVLCSSSLFKKELFVSFEHHTQNNNVAKFRGHM